MGTHAKYHKRVLTSKTTALLTILIPLVTFSKISHLESSIKVLQSNTSSISKIMLKGRCLLDLKVLHFLSNGVGFKKQGLLEWVRYYNDLFKPLNGTNHTTKSFNTDKLSLEKNKTEIDTNLLKKLKKQMISPLTYFIYQMYENSQKCNGEYNELKTVCMGFPEYDKDNRTLTFSYLSEYREINDNTNIKKIAVKAIKNLTRELGLDGNTKGMIQSILKAYGIPITVEKNNLFLNNKPICIKILLRVGFDIKLYSYFGLRDCNAEIKVIKKQKAYVL